MATTSIVCVAAFSAKQNGNNHRQEVLRPIGNNGSTANGNDHSHDNDKDDDTIMNLQTLLQTRLIDSTPPSAVWHVSFSRDGKYLASCHAAPENCIKVWKQQNQQWELVASLEGVHKRTIRRAEFGPGYVIASASFDGSVCIWECSSSSSPSSSDSDNIHLEWDCTAQLEGHENEVKGVAWNNDGTLLATCGRDKSVWIWECLWTFGSAGGSEFECGAVLNGHDGDVKSVLWVDKQQFGSGDEGEEWLLSTSYDDTIRLWAEDDGDWFCVHVLEKGHFGTIWDITSHYSPIGNTVLLFERTSITTATATSEGGNNNNGCASSSPIKRCKQKRRMSDIEIHNHQRHVLSIISCGQDGTVTTWQLIKPPPIKSSTNPRLVASSGGDAKWHIVDQLTVNNHNSNSDVNNHHQTSPIFSIHSNYNRDDDDDDDIMRESTDFKTPRFIVTGGGDNTITLYQEHKFVEEENDSSSNQIDVEEPCDESHHPQQTRDDKTASNVISNQCWDKVSTIMNAHDGDVNCVRWNPKQPTTFASSGDDGMIRIWNVMVGS